MLSDLLVMDAKPKGYWYGLPAGLKGRAVGWAVYYLFAAILFFQNPFLGIALLVLPSLWYLGKNWLFAEAGVALDIERKETLSGYTLNYFWTASMYARVALIAVALAIAVGGLAWVSTEKMRLKAAEPTFSERVTSAADAAMEKTAEATGSAIEATKETTSGWYATAKGWFVSHDESVEPR